MQKPTASKIPDIYPIFSWNHAEIVETKKQTINHTRVIIRYCCSSLISGKLKVLHRLYASRVLSAKIRDGYDIHLVRGCQMSCCSLLNSNTITTDFLNVF